MTDQPNAQTGAGEKPARIVFGGETRFQNELKARVEAYFSRTGRRRRDCPQMYLKTALILAWLAGSYGLLVFAAESWWEAVALAASVGLATAAVGFNIMHDGGHQAFSRSRLVNRVAGLSLDLIGGSSYYWRYKHGVLHHTFTNVAGIDTDLDMGGLGRLAPAQPYRKFHRWQHWYVWFLYGFIAPKWHLHDDFKYLLYGKMGNRVVNRPAGKELGMLLGGKLVFFGFAFGLPLLYHPLWAVVACYLLAGFVMGLVISGVFQLAHCVEEASFPSPWDSADRDRHQWAVHQVETTIDFLPGNRVASWFLGGLNYQIEHHLFPHICHVNYPALSRLVEETCTEFGIPYQRHRSLWAGLRSHFRWLRTLSVPVPAV